jgi:hypothetical protein
MSEATQNSQQPKSGRLKFEGLRSIIVFFFLILCTTNMWNIKKLLLVKMCFYVITQSNIDRRFTIFVLVYCIPIHHLIPKIP